MATTTWSPGDNERSKQAFEYMHEIRRYKHLCDVTLVTNDAEIAAHKVVLASCSLYFHMKFVLGKTGDTLIMEGIEGDILKILIDYIYSSKLSITPENVRELMLLANTLMLPEVLEKCSDYLKDRLDPNNCLEMAEWAHSHKFLNLKSNAEDYFGFHYWDVIDNNQFLKASYHQFLILLVTAKKESLLEETVLECILSWIDHDTATREVHLDDLLDYIDMSLIETDYLMLKLDDPLLKGNSKYITKAMDAVRSKYKRAIVADSSMRGTDTQRKCLATSSMNEKERCIAADQSWTVLDCWIEPAIRQSVDVVTTSCPTRSNVTISNLSKTKCSSSSRSLARKGDTLVVAGRSGNKLSVETYNFKSKTWTEIPIIKKTPMIEDCAILILDAKIYLISGDITNNVEIYDLTSEQWIPARPFLGKRGFMGVTTLNGTIYATGGFHNINYQNMKTNYSTAKVYSWEKGTWENIKAMNTHRYGHGLGVLDDKIFAVGGHSTKGFSKNVEYYNTVTNNWSPVKNMSFERYKPGVVGMNGILYAIGGSDSPGEMLSTVESYDPNCNYWLLNCEMHYQREAPGVIAYKEHIYVAGGRHRLGLLKSFEMYDIATNRWSLLPDMLTAKEDVSMTLM